jgi:uncharacterized membrane protein YphA (DoxX/SURF4 family)
MTSSQSKPLTILVWLARLALGGIFIYAAWTKLRDPWLLFAMAIDAYHVLPQWAVMVVARTLPWFELVLGLVLISGKLPRISSVAASVLLSVFFGLMVQAYAKGETIACGCFGPGEAISPMTLLRDGSLLAGALFLAVVSFWPKKPRFERPAEYSGAANPGRSRLSAGETR